MPERPRLSQVQVAVLTIASMLALGVFSYPREAVESGGHSAFYGTLGSGLFAFGGAALIALTAAKFPGKTAVGVFRTVLGPLVYPLVVLPAAFEIIYLGVVTRNFLDLMKEIFYMDTPDTVLIFVLLAVAAYQAQKGLEAMARSIQLTLFVVLAILFGGYLASIGRIHAHFLTFQPPHLTEAVKAAFMVTYVWVGYPVLFMFLGFARDRRSLRNGVGLGFLVVGILLVIVYLDSLGLFGLMGMRRVNWPTVSVLRLLRVHGFLIERLGLLVLVGWVVLVLNSLSLHMWAVAYALGELFNRTRLFSWVIVAMVPTTLLMSRIPANLAQLFQLLPYISAIGAVEGWFLAGLVLVVARVRGLGGGRSPGPGK
ncbi:MAG: GerAB/ArcD/ProY family transporter [Bacillota bacterium]